MKLACTVDNISTDIWKRWTFLVVTYSLPEHPGVTKKYQCFNQSEITWEFNCVQSGGAPSDYKITGSVSGKIYLYPGQATVQYKTCNELYATLKVGVEKR